VTELTTDTTLPGHREAMALGTTEYQRFIDLLRSLSADDWTAPTDCPPWDVRAMVAHNLGNMSANASTREMAHQMRTAIKRSKASGQLMVDELTALQISERASLSPAELLNRISTMAPRAVAGRRRMPGMVRRYAKVAGPPPFGRITLGYLCDTIFTRDVWMHRVDISRATGRDMVLTAGHDGRLVAAIVGEWASAHNQPYDLMLDGPAGGRFVRGDSGEQVHLDALEFCRILSGRDAANAQGLLATPVLY
jgi:uncharacterized protein (TIGR03083 family)